MEGFYSQLLMRFKVVPLSQWWIPGHPLFLDQTEAQRAGNFFSETPSPPPPLYSEALDLPLCYLQQNVKSVVARVDFAAY